MNASQILYIDDEEENLFVFRSAFRNDYQILTAQSGKAALEVLRDTPDIALIITDQRMPEMSGVEFLETIIPSHPDPVRVILTGYTDLNDIVSAINFGRIYHYATKPWNKTALKIIIDKALEFYALKRMNTELIENLEKKNNKLIAVIDELEMFLYRSSHDLKGPLSSLMGLIHISKTETDIDRLKDYIGKFEKTVTGLDKTLAKLTKINTANIAGVLYEDVKIAKLVHQVVQHYEPDIARRGINMIVGEDPDNTTIRCNPEFLKTIVESLLENAIHFSRESPRVNPYIRIDWSVTQDIFTLRVEDNGVGIDKSVFSRIFEPFFRGHGNAKGNGLGLYIVNKSLGKLHGEVTVTSEVSSGSTFTIHLPANGINLIGEGS